MILPEGLIWNYFTEEINFVDIEGKKLYRNRKLRSEIIHKFDKSISFAIPRSKNHFLIGYDNSICNFYLNEKKIELLATVKNKSYRTNDAFLDASGNLWFGVMHKTDSTEKGALYKFSFDRKLELFDHDYLIPNGPIFVSENKFLIHNDSKLGLIYIYKNHNSKASREILFDCNSLSQNCAPDGMCLDSFGYLYVAMWGYGCVCKFNKHMEIIETIKTPTDFPTNVLKVDKKIAITYAESKKNMNNGGLLILEN